MQYHPHLHIVIPGIALSDDGQRIYRSKGRKYLFPKAVLNVVFRNRIKKLLREKDDTEQTGHLKKIDPNVWKMPWVVNAKAVGKGTAAVRYLARYVFKSALSERRLLGYTEDGKVRVNCQNSKTGAWKEIHLTPGEFLRRWSLHVLPKRLVRVRHYGFLSAAGRKNREKIEQILGEKAGQNMLLPTRENGGESQSAGPPAESPKASKPKCPCCGKEMQWKADLKRLELWTQTWEKTKPACVPSRPRPPNGAKTD